MGGNLIRQIVGFIQGILENKASDLITRKRIVMGLDILWGLVATFWGLSWPNFLLGIFVLSVFALWGIEGTLRLRDRWRGTPAVSTRPTQDLERQPQQTEVLLIEDDSQDNIEQKHHLRMFADLEMDKARLCMQQMSRQVHGQLGAKGGVYHYFVRALLHFMAPLEERSENLTNFLAARVSLSNSDFIEAQHQLAQLYRLYEERMPWVRDLAWYTNPNIRTCSDYKNWEDADRNMRKELERLLPECPVLSTQITDPNAIDPWWWEKTPSS